MVSKRERKTEVTNAMLLTNLNLVKNSLDSDIDFVKKCMAEQHIVNREIIGLKRRQLIATSVKSLLSFLHLIAIIAILFKVFEVF